MGLHCDNGQTQMKDSRIHLALLHIQGLFRFMVKEGKVVRSLIGVSGQEKGVECVEASLWGPSIPTPLTVSTH